MEFSCIESCIYLDPKTYMHDTEISPETPKSVPPATYIEVFSTRFEDHEGEEEMDHVRRQLAPLRVKMDGRDVYDKKIVVERDLQWFERHKRPEEDIARHWVPQK